MTREELKQWAKNYVKKYRWEILGAAFIASIIPAAISGVYTKNAALNLIFSLASIIITLFLEIGFAKFITEIINGKDANFSLLFSKFNKECKQTIITAFLRCIWIFIYSLLLIVPGIIKAISYSLVPYLLADDANKKLEPKQVLDLSGKMMYGHKSEFFVLSLSFVGWHILAIFTLGILELWIIPYQQLTISKFLLDIKNNYQEVK